MFDQKHKINQLLSHICYTSFKDHHQQWAARVGEWVDVMKDDEQVLSPVDTDALPAGVYRLVNPAP